MPYLSQLSNFTTTALSLSNLILVSPNEDSGYQPQNAPTNNGTQSRQPATILFNYEGEQTVTLESDITDHYVEDNSAVQDQIALKPILVTTQGFIGELNDVVPSILAPIKFIADKLITVSAFVPQLSTTALIAYNEAKLLYDIAGTAIDSAVSIWNTVTGGSQQTKQQKYFSLFKGYFSKRTLFTVQTPWAKFDNMAIKTLRAIQDAETRMVTDFEITFKQIQYANTYLTLRANSAFLQGRASAQGALLNDLGISTPPVSSQSFLGNVGGIA